MGNYAKINYDTSVLELNYRDQKFKFDFGELDVGDWWYGFECSDGKSFDVNYFLDPDGDEEIVAVYPTMIDDEGYLTIDTSESDEVDITEIIGDSKKQFVK